MVLAVTRAICTMGYCESENIGGPLSYCELLVVSFERSRTEMSIPLHLTAWECRLTWSPGLALAPYATSRCVGVNQCIFRFIVAPIPASEAVIP
jgi:hypothetical protein